MERKHVTFTLALLALFTSGFCRADVFTVRQAIEIAQGRNPDIRSLESQVESSEAKAGQAFAPAEPSLTLNYNDTPTLFNLSGAASTVYQLSQPLSFPGKAFVNHAELNNQTKSLRSQLRSKRLGVSVAVRTAYYNLGLARKSLELNLDQKRSYSQILEIARRRYEAGSITQVDLMVAQSNLYSNENDLADLQAAEQTARAQLNLLLGRPAGDSIEIDPLTPEPLKAFDRGDTEKKMLANQPEIQSAQYQRDATDNAYTLAWMSLLPDFQLFVGTTYYNFPGATPYSSTTNQPHTYMAGIQLTIPIWALFNERESITAAAKDRGTAEAALDSQRLQSKTQLETTLQTLGAQETKLRNYKLHLIPLSEQTLQLAMVSYSSGKIDFQTLAEAASSWRSTETAYYTMWVNYLTTYYSVGQLTGEDL